MINNVNELLATLDVDCPAKFGRSVYKYVDCGPWVCYLTEDDDVYYMDATKENVTNENCVGVSVGSIVEGSEVGLGPIEMRFPFEEDAFWTNLEDINYEASVEWEEANLAEDY